MPIEPSYKDMLAQLVERKKQLGISLWACTLLDDMQASLSKDPNYQFSLADVTELERIYYHYLG